MSAAYDVRVTGRVQGVWFRAYVAEQAEALGVTGWVANEPDGSLAGHFEGDTASVVALLELCRTGPSLARVDRVDSQPAEVTGAASFEVRG